MASSLEELSDQLIYIIKSKDGSLNDVIEFLNEQGEKKARDMINTMGKKSEKTPLMEACWQSKESIVKLLLTSGADPNIISYNNNLTALIYTIEKDEIKESDLNIVRMLWEHGANLNFRYGGQSALEYASFPFYTHLPDKRKGAYELAELLIQLGADVNTKDNEGKTPLMLTIMGLDKALPLLIKAGVNLDVQDNKGETALMKFVKRKSDEMVNALLDAKANVFIKNLRGLTAVELEPYDDLFQSWYKANINFIPRLTKAYLQPLCLYFKESAYQHIQNDVREFLKNVNDDNSFPIKSYHLSAMNKLLELSFNDFDSLYMKFPDDLSYLVYFGTDDFEEKVYVDVLNRISEDDAEIDQQILKGMRARAKSGKETNWHRLII